MIFKPLNASLGRCLDNSGQFVGFYVLTEGNNKVVNLDLYDADGNLLKSMKNYWVTKIENKESLLISQSLNDDQKRGCCSFDGRIILDVVYDDIYSIGSDYYLAEKDDKLPLYDVDGNYIKEFSVESMKECGLSSSQVDDELIPVSNGEEWGYADLNGKMIIDYQYDDAEVFVNGYAVVEQNNENMVIDKNNKVVLSASGDYMSDAYVVHYTHSDKQDNTVFKVSVDDDITDSNSREIYWVENNDIFFETDDSSGVQFFSSEDGKMYMLEYETGKCVDQDGNVVLNGGYESAYEKNNRIYRYNGHTFEILDLDGNILKALNETYVDIIANYTSKYNMMAAFDGEKSGFIDLNGNWIMDVEK